MNDNFATLVRRSSLRCSEAPTDIESLKLIAIFSASGLLLSLAAIIYWPELGAEIAQSLCMLS
ncbi:hypothetical protein ACVIW2_009355 [Bradyrhizobium huanghuaihaiense]